MSQRANDSSASVATAGARRHTSVLGALRLMTQLRDHEVERDLGLGRDRVRSEHALPHVESHRAPRVIRDPRVALIGEVDVDTPRVSGDPLEPGELALRQRTQTVGDRDVVGTDVHLHAPLSVGRTEGWFAGLTGSTPRGCGPR